jgi:hypothetical protein
VQIHAMIYDRIAYDVLNRMYRQYVPHMPPAHTVWSVQLTSETRQILANMRHMLESAGSSMAERRQQGRDRVRGACLSRRRPIGSRWR